MEHSPSWETNNSTSSQNALHFVSLKASLPPLQVQTTFLSPGGLEVACWPLVLKFAGSNPAEAVGFFKGEKILNTPSFGGEVKPSVPCRRFGACKSSLNGVEFVISAKLPDSILAHNSTFRTGISHVVADVGAPGGESGSV
jgi:hypothetical protein